MKAWLDLKTLQNLTVRAGQVAKFDVKIGGEPPPDATWLKNDKPIEQNANIFWETKKGVNSVFTIKSAARSDCGKYTIIVKNNIGQNQGTAELTVLGMHYKR